MTVPGVGALTAVTYLTTIDAPERFRHSRDLGPHLGLTPSASSRFVHASGQRMS